MGEARLPLTPASTISVNYYHDCKNNDLFHEHNKNNILREILKGIELIKWSIINYSSLIMTKHISEIHYSAPLALLHV